MTHSDQRPIIMSAPHAHSAIDDEHRSRFALSDFELWKCSDPYTDRLDEFTCAWDKVIGQSHRLLGDLNRGPDVEVAFRNTDFFGRDAFLEDQAFSREEKEQLLTQNWHPFHEQVLESIRRLDAQQPEVILLVDYHNTSGDHALNQDREYMPSMVLSNLGTKKTGETDPLHPVTSMPAEFMAYFQNRVADHLGIRPEINTVYYGGYNLNWYAALQNELNTHATLYAVQIEYNLDHVFNPISKKFDEEALQKLQTALNQSLIQLYDHLLEQPSPRVKPAHVLEKELIAVK